MIFAFWNEAGIIMRMLDRGSKIEIPQLKLTVVSVSGQRKIQRICCVTSALGLGQLLFFLKVSIDT